MATRTRRYYSPEFKSGHYTSYIGGTLQQDINWNRTFARNRHVTVDDVHNWRERRAHPSYDIGGPFHSMKATVEVTWDLDRVYRVGPTGGVNVQTWDTHVLPAHNYMSYIGTNVEADFVNLFEQVNPLGPMTAKGTTAIARTIPTNPMMDGAVSAAEFYREGIPSLIGSTLLKDRIGFLRSLGSEYLNIEFGWKPLISDLQSLAKTVVASEKILQQLARDSGRDVRRRLAFPAVRNTSQSRDVINFDPNFGNMMSQAGRDVREWSYQRAWFSGAYTFHYDPAGLSEASRIATQARLLYGLDLNPEVLWNLAPWSWLVDWFVNIGPVLHNLSAFGQDGLVLRYGYLMSHSVRRVDIVNNKIQCVGTFPNGTHRSRIALESKRRIRATPFGFGLLMNQLSVRQWAILGALGMTKAPGVV